MRKSLERRLAESNNLLVMYQKSHLESDYRARFVADMILRMSTGKSISKKQRTWLDSLIEEGVPEIEFDRVLFEKIQSAISNPGMGYKRKVLADFSAKIRSGSKLSEKQHVYLNSMLKEHEQIEIDGPYKPTASQEELLQQAIDLSSGYSQMYWTTHPGTYKAVKNISEWLESDKSTYIDKYSVDKVLKTMRSKLNELNENPYVKKGAMVWYRSGGKVLSGICTSDPFVMSGKIYYDILSSGNISPATKESLMKRRAKE